MDGAPPNSKFADGSHTILYTARDDVGNTATCTIRFQVKGEFYFWCQGQDGHNALGFTVRLMNIKIKFCN